MSAALQLVTDVDTCQHDGPDLREWIALDDAAERLGLNRDHLARECRSKLKRHGRAMKAQPQGGGAAKWFVARRHDPRLAPGSLGEAYQAPDLSAYTRRQVDDAYARVACVYEQGKVRLTGDGRMLLTRLANLPGLGGLRLCAKVVQVAWAAASGEGSGAMPFRKLPRPVLDELALRLLTPGCVVAEVQDWLMSRRRVGRSSIYRFNQVLRVAADEVLRGDPLALREHGSPVESPEIEGGASAERHL